jgi:hypothetical protein
MDLPGLVRHSPTEPGDRVRPNPVHNRPRVPVNELVPEPRTPVLEPHAQAETHLPPARAAACAHTSMQMSERPVCPAQSFSKRMILLNEKLLSIKNQ